MEDLGDEKNECASTKQGAVKQFELLIGSDLGDLVLVDLSLQLRVLEAYLLNLDFQRNYGGLEFLLLG